MILKKNIIFFLILTVFIAASFIGCQKNINQRNIDQLEKVDILVNADNENIGPNTNSVGLHFTVNNNSDKYIVVSYFDNVYGEEYLTVDEAPYTIVEPKTTNPNFGFGYEYSSKSEFEKIVSQIYKEYHFRVYLCDKDYLNSDNPIHKDQYRDITVVLQK